MCPPEVKGLGRQENFESRAGWKPEICPPSAKSFIDSGRILRGILADPAC